MNKINLENHGDGIWSDYSKQDSRLTVYYQIPTLEQLKDFRIKEFNRSWGFCVEGIEEKKITKETYEIYLKNLTQRFIKKPENYLDSTLFDNTYDNYDLYDDLMDHLLGIYPICLFGDCTLDPPAEIILDSLGKIIPFKNKEEELDSEFLLQLKLLEFSSVEDIYEHYCLEEGAGMPLVLYASGWTVSELQEGDNFYLKVEFPFNKRVNNWFAEQTEERRISFWSQDWMEFMTDMSYSSFNLHDYITKFRKRHTVYFEMEIDSKNIPEQEIHN